MKQKKLSSPLYYCRMLFTLVLTLVILTGCESRRTIVNGVDEKEANEILVFLATKAIGATKLPAPSEGPGASKGLLWNISVDTSNATEAMALLNQAGLPRRKSTTLIDVFSNVGLVPSGMADKVRFQAGLAEQIASTVRKIDGVLDSEVSLSFPEEDPLNLTGEKNKITASVYVKHNGVLDDPNAHLITKIKRYVAGSVNGLSFENVTLISDRARFGEALVGDYVSSQKEEKKFVSIWSIVLAQDSVGRFRTLFALLSLSLLLLIIFSSFLIWKFSLLIAEAGGVKQIFKPKRLSTEDLNRPVEDAKQKKDEDKDEDNSEDQEDYRSESEDDES